jgi:hypothetical protein
MGKDIYPLGHLAPRSNLIIDLKARQAQTASRSVGSMPGTDRSRRNSGWSAAGTGLGHHLAPRH